MVPALAHVVVELPKYPRWPAATTPMSSQKMMITPPIDPTRTRASSMIVIGADAPLIPTVDDVLTGAPPQVRPSHPSGRPFDAQRPTGNPRTDWTPARTC